MSLGSRDDTLFEGAVEIQGDTETGQQLQDILASAEWDWEEQLSRFTGDVVAHQVGTLARRARRLLGSSRDTLERDISEYLQEECLRADLDRLSARVERLLQATAAGQ